MLRSLLPEPLASARDPLHSQAELSDRLRCLYAEEVSRLVRGVIGSAALFEEIWRQCVQGAARGETEEIQAQRESLRQGFTLRLDLLRRAGTMAGQVNGSASAELANEIGRMERLQERVFDKWKTAEDLEDLAARDYPLSRAELDRIGATRQPPQSWYEEQSTPL